MIIEKKNGLVPIDNKISAARFHHRKIRVIQKGMTNQGHEGSSGRRRGLRSKKTRSLVRMILQITVVSLVSKHKALGGTNVIVEVKGSKFA